MIFNNVNTAINQSLIISITKYLPNKSTIANVTPKSKVSSSKALPSNRFLPFRFQNFLFHSF